MTLPPHLRDLVTINHGLDLKRLGSDYGGWTFCPSLLRTNTIIQFLLVGAGEDLTFDLEVSRMFPLAHAHIFDPTPRAITHFHRLSDQKKDSELDLWDRISFYPYAVWDTTKTVRFYEPANPLHVSHSITNLQNTDKSINVLALDVATIDRVCRCEDEGFDLIKMDVEGAEIEIVFRMVAALKKLPNQILIEFDDLRKYPDPKAYSRVVTACHKLIDSGYKLVNVDGLANFSFALID